MLLAVLRWGRHTYETTEVGAGGPSGSHVGQTEGMEPTFSHFGICVSDLDRSLRFYCDAFGFEKAESHDIGWEFARLMDFPDVVLTSQFIRKGDTAIELLAFTDPPPSATGCAGHQPTRVDPPLVPGR